MPVFTLTKYAEAKPSEDAIKPEDTPERTEEMVSINASSPVSKMVALALHKHLAHVREEEGEDVQADTAVVSTEEINLDPVGTYNRTKHAKQVVIVNEGFKTPQEEWMLMSLESQGKPVFYSIERYLQTLGVAKEAL